MAFDHAVCISGVQDLVRSLADGLDEILGAERFFSQADRI